MAQRVAWQLSVAPGEQLRIRCIRDTDGTGFLVQLRENGRWTDTKLRHTDPVALLRHVVTMKGITDVLAKSFPR